MHNILENLWSAFNDIKFTEETHIYTDSRNTKYTSSTQFIKRFYPYKDWDAQLKKSAEKRGIDPATLRKEWDYKGEYATTLGTELHGVMEMLWQKKDYAGNKAKMDSYDGMWEEFLLRKLECIKLFEKMKRIYIPIATELVVNDPENGIAGSMDFLAYDFVHKYYVIIDWKSSAEFNLENTFGPNRSHIKLLEPFDSYDDANVNQYSLQLSLYKYIIEKYTKIKIGDMILFQLPKAGQFPKVQRCNDMSGILSTILK